MDDRRTYRVHLANGTEAEVQATHIEEYGDSLIFGHPLVFVACGSEHPNGETCAVFAPGAWLWVELVMEAQHGFYNRQS